jgi:hypothetical protein
MKHKLFYILPLALALASGCVSNKNNNPAPVTPPTGTFSGEFKLTHLNRKTGAIDSAKTTIQLQMEVATGYKVTGDTTTLHAGSYGSFFVSSDGTAIQFVDQTYPPAGDPTKIHLSGIYQYEYNGSNLQVLGYGPQDTLSFYYNLYKTGN